MVDPINRFTTRVENYAKFRPTYPHLIIDLLKVDCGLTEASMVADVGSGTGILSEMLLRNGNTVFGVEPNAEMRSAAEKLLRNYHHFRSVDGSAEATTLESHSIDIVTAAQAFHWFGRERARVEFARILKPQGWVALIWNERRLDSTPFLRAFEQLLLQYGTDYQTIRHENVTGQIGDFFAPQKFKRKSFENIQTFDFESLMGRVRSASYTPEPDNPKFEPMVASLREAFEKHQRAGTIAFEYDTTIYYGNLEKQLEGKMDKERRNDERVPTNLPAKWDGLSGGHEARIEDISLGGCFVNTTGLVDIGEVVVLQVKLPSGEWLTLRGEATTSQEGIGFGLNFSFITDEEEYALRELISNRTSY